LFVNNRVCPTRPDAARTSVGKNVPGFAPGGSSAILRKRYSVVSIFAFDRGSWDTDVNVNQLNCHIAAMARRDFSSSNSRTIDPLFIGGTATFAGIRTGSGEDLTALPGPRGYSGVDAANSFCDELITPP
jgi:hypothetical protein